MNASFRAPLTRTVPFFIEFSKKQKSTHWLTLLSLIINPGQNSNVAVPIFITRNQINV